jgi:hypothetical protein
MNKTIKVVIIIVIGLFAITAASYGEGIYSNQTGSTATNSSYAGGLYGNSAAGTGESSSGGLFRSGSTPDDPTRPGNGGGIGQESPLFGGMYFLLVCTVFYGIIKYFGEKSKKFGGFDI